MKEATPLTLPDIRRALLVLLQHSCVFSRIPSDDDTKAAPHQPLYRANPPAAYFLFRQDWHLVSCLLSEAYKVKLSDKHVPAGTRSVCGISKKYTTTLSRRAS